MKGAETIFLILLFFSTYFFIGAFIYDKTGVPNATSDFLFHYAKATNNFSLVQDYYKQASFDKYPGLFHLFAKPFLENQLLFYGFGLFLICCLLPALLYLNAGKGAVLTYFLGVSLPHLAVYSAVYPSVLIFCIFLFYLLFRKNLIVFFICWVAATLTHNYGFVLFLVVGVAEILNNFVMPKIFPALIFLVRQDKPFLIVAGFLTHLNFLLVWFCRKRFDTFFLILFLAGTISAFSDLRALAIPQLIICVLAGKELSARPRWWFPYALLPLFAFNFLDFATATARFLSA